MADYYPLLAKALANLPTRTASTARRAIYERARKALIGQLRSIQPAMAEGDIANEDAALDKAIARLEAEYEAQLATAGAPHWPPAATPASAPAAQKPAPVARPTPAAAPRPQPPPAARPTASNPPAVPEPPPKAPTAPRRPAMGQSTPAAPAAAPAPAPVRAEPLIGSERAPGGVGRSLPAPPVAVERASPADDHGHAPPVAASPPVAAGLAPLRADGDSGRPSAPGRPPPPRRNPSAFVALIAFLGVAAIALAAYLWKEQPRDLGIRAPDESADTTGAAGQNKIARRIGAGDEGEPKPAAEETPIPTVPVPVTAVPVAPTPPPAPAAPAASQVPAPGAAAPEAKPAPPQRVAENAAPAAVLPASSRAAMLIGVQNDPKPLVDLGSALWSIIPATSGQPSTLAVRIEVEIPDAKMHVTVTIRKNADPGLPATHTIDLRATFADGAEIKGIQDLALPQLRRADATSGDALSGVKVKISDGYYLIGLTRSDADAAHNLGLLAARTWFDFPMLLTDERIAKLTFEKGDTGDRVMAQALDAWK